MTPDQLLDKVAEQFNFANWIDLKDNAFPIDAETVAAMIKFGANLYAGHKIDEVEETRKRRYPSGKDEALNLLPGAEDIFKTIAKAVDPTKTIRMNKDFQYLMDQIHGD